MTKTEKMFALVEEWKSSGKTQKIFCREHDLKLSTLAYWIARKKRTEEPSGGFLAVEVGGEAGRQVKITYPNGVTLTTGNADLNLISRLVGLW